MVARSDSDLDEESRSMLRTQFLSGLIVNIRCSLSHGIVHGQMRRKLGNGFNGSTASMSVPKRHGTSLLACAAGMNRGSRAWLEILGLIEHRLAPSADLRCS